MSDFRDGVCFVQLAPLSDPALVAQQAALTLGVRDEPGHPILETLTLFVHDRHMLLVFDNCEHLLEACARLAGNLLLAGPGLRILATSRERLGVAGEAVFPVPSLPFPEPGQAFSAENVDDYPAVRLFADRARLVLPDYQVTHDNAAAVARICQRLDGIPLAIEMAAARLNVLTAEEIVHRLDDTFGLLTRGDRTALPRQQTLRATIDWSYQLLSVEERQLLQRLSVFGGGCTLEAAEVICSGTSEDGTDILDLLASLVDKSVVVADQRSGEATRYRLLEAIREYALERLVANGEFEIVRHKHMVFFRSVAVEADPQLTSPLREVGLETMKAEQDNLRAALQWAKESQDALAGLQLAGALWLFWFSLGNLSEGRGWLEGALAQAETLDAPAARLKVLLAAGNLAWFQSDYVAARGLLEEAQAIGRRLGAPGQRDLAYSLLWLGLVKRDQGDLAIARPLLEESVAICRETRDRGTLALGLVTLGRTVVVGGNPAFARPILEEGLTIFLEFRDTWGQALALNNLGLAAFREGDHRRATALYQEGIALFWQVEERVFTVRCIEELAWVTCTEGHYGRATRLFGAAEAQREAFGASMPPAGRAEHGQHVADAHAQLGDAAFTTAWTEGRAMTMEQTVAYALADTTL